MKQLIVYQQLNTGLPKSGLNYLLPKKNRCKFFLCCLLFLSLHIYSQKIDEDDAPKKKNETKITEVVTTDSLPASELLQRAVNWVKQENNHYSKTSGATTGSKAECVVTFPVKPKELNPEVDYSGKISMKVSIECKDNKYKYTVAQIKHNSTSGKATAGSIDNKVPECGSMVMSEIVWKKLRGEALRASAKVVDDIKEGMQKSSTETVKEEW